MRCDSFCLAQSYDLQKIAELFIVKDYLVKRYGKKFLHIYSQKEEEYNIFIFAHGCIVTWNIEKREQDKIFSMISDFAKNQLAHFESNNFIFNYEDETKVYVDKSNRDVIVLGSSDIQLKLAISYGLAQSIKLEYFEQSVQNTVNKNSYLTYELARHGKIPLSGREISRRMGHIFSVRSLINLDSEYLDIPEYFWENPALEDYYSIIVKFLDLSKRVSALNQRLDVLQDLFTMLNNQLQHVHSSILEWTIIILIFIEIIIMVIYYLL